MMGVGVNNKKDRHNSSTSRSRRRRVHGSGSRSPSASPVVSSLPMGDGSNIGLDSGSGIVVGSSRKIDVTDGNDNSYYDDDDSDGGDDNVRGTSQSKRLYSGSCPVGKFFLNPCLFIWTVTRRGRIFVCSKWQSLRGDRRVRVWGSSSDGGGTGASSFTTWMSTLGYSTHTRRNIKEGRIRRDILIVSVTTIIILWIFLRFLMHHHSAIHLYPHYHPYRRGGHPILQRPSSEWELLSIPLLIRRLDFTSVNDPGGWLYPPRNSFPSYQTLFRIEDEEQNDPKPYYNGLVFNSLSQTDFRRTINPKDDELYTNETMERFKHMDKVHVSSYYADDDTVRHETCRRVNWYKLYNPNCNSFHELDLSRDHQEGIAHGQNDVDEMYEAYYISHGYYRDVWSIDNLSNPEDDDKESIVLKMMRYKYKFNFKDIATVRQDALIMERLTSSPRIVDIYGHCGTSVTVENIENEVEEFVVPGTGYAKKSDLNDARDVDPKNEYTPTEKLTMALEMAESLADLHGFKDGVIVHDDVQLCQWLRTKDGKLKLGDFNRAEVMLWDEENQQYCKYNNGKGYGNYRAPEEFAAIDLDEKIDVFSFGNNIYGLLTGLWVFYENEDDGVVQEKLIKGDLPFIDERYRTRSYAEGKLVEIMEKCWVYKPEERVSIFEVVDFLKEAVAENARLEAAKKK